MCNRCMIPLNIHVCSATSSIRHRQLISGLEPCGLWCECLTIGVRLTSTHTVDALWETVSSCQFSSSAYPAGVCVECGWPAVGAICVLRPRLKTDTLLVNGAHSLKMSVHARRGAATLIHLARVGAGRVLLEGRFLFLLRRAALFAL